MAGSRKRRRDVDRSAFEQAAFAGFGLPISVPSNNITISMSTPLPNGKEESCKRAAIA